MLFKFVLILSSLAAPLQAVVVSQSNQLLGSNATTVLLLKRVLGTDQEHPTPLEESRELIDVAATVTLESEISLTELVSISENIIELGSSILTPDQVQPPIRVILPTTPPTPAQLDLASAIRRRQRRTDELIHNLNLQRAHLIRMVKESYPEVRGAAGTGDMTPFIEAVQRSERSFAAIEGHRQFLLDRNARKIRRLEEAMNST